MLYSVTNPSRNDALVADKVELADRALSRLRGLLGRDGLADGEGLHIVPCNSIHMFFMRFPIDVAFLDEDLRVVKTVHQIRPWRATRIYLDAHSALELPAGALARSGTREGDQLRFSARPQAAAEAKPDPEPGAP
jgi:uncharacterized membrane protein (UPF0127 family)